MTQPYDDLLYAVKHIWFYSGREDALKKAKEYSEIFDLSPNIIMEKARKIKL